MTQPKKLYRSLGSSFTVGEVLSLLKEGGCKNPEKADIEVDSYMVSNSYGTEETQVDTMVSWYEGE